MSDPKPMPRQIVTIAGGLIALSALAGLAFGAVGDIRGHSGSDANGGEVVAPIKTVANATALVAPPVTEADVRRWTREELQAQRAAAPRKPRVDTDPGVDEADADPAAPSTVIAPAAPAKPSATPSPKPASGQQIPF
jgi:hypothetical protein